jgi:GNAT superfamily N-acetyltransferase
MEIREVTSVDKDRWLELFHGYISFYESHLTEEQYEVTWTRLLDPTSKIFGLVAILNDEIVGIAHYLFHPSTWSLQDHCYLQDLFVDPQIRGLGVGRKLIQQVYEIALKEGSPRLYWVTKASNLQARALYDSFVPVSDMVQYRMPISLPSPPAIPSHDPSTSAVEGV